MKVAASNPEKDSGIVIDREWLKRADLWPFERVEVYNASNGARFSTFVRAGEPASGRIEIGGAEAHLVQAGHRIAIVAFARISEQDLAGFTPRLFNPESKTTASTASYDPALRLPF